MMADGHMRFQQWSAEAWAKFITHALASVIAAIKTAAAETESEYLADEGGPRDSLVQNLAADMYRHLLLGRTYEAPPRGWTFTAIAERHHVSVERVRRVWQKLCPDEAKAMKRRYNSRSKDDGNT